MQEVLQFSTSAEEGAIENVQWYRQLRASKAIDQILSRRHAQRWQPEVQKSVNVQREAGKEMDDGVIVS